MRVLQIVQNLDIGGLETLVVELSSHLKEKGIEVELLCFRNVDEKYATILKEKNIPIQVIHEKSRFSFDFYKHTLNFIRSGNFDVIHAHSGCHLRAAVLAKKSGISKFIYTAHGMPIFTRFRDRMEDSFSAFLTDEIVSVSYEINDYLKKWFLYSNGRFTTIINGVDTYKFKPCQNSINKLKLLKKYSLPEDRILFGSVGRLVTVKNYSMVLLALKRLVEAGIENIGFVLVGGGYGDSSHKKYLLNMVSELNLSEYVCFLGAQESIHEIIPLFNFFVLSSLTEGTSISLLESQSCGLPAIVTDVGGNRNIIEHGLNGYLCCLNDDEKMAEYMLELLNDYTLATEMGKEGRRRMLKEFSIESMVREYIEIYN